MSLRMKRTLLGVIIVCIMVLIFVFSSQNALESTKVSSGVIAKLVSIVVPGYKNMPVERQLEIVASLQFIVRKCAHFSIYMVLGFLVMALMSTFPLDRRVQIIYTVIFCSLYAMSDEFHQLFIPGRSCELRDVGIDTLGALTGSVICFLIIKLYTVIGSHTRYVD